MWFLRRNLYHKFWSSRKKIFHTFLVWTLYYLVASDFFYNSSSQQRENKRHKVNSVPVNYLEHNIMNISFMQWHRVKMFSKLCWTKTLKLNFPSSLLKAPRAKSNKILIYKTFFLTLPKRKSLLFIQCCSNRRLK